MQESEVWDLFLNNWVFRLFSWHNPGFKPSAAKSSGIFSKIFVHIRSSYVLTIISIGLAIFFSGALGAALIYRLDTYIFSVPPYLSSIGIALGLTAFAWFTKVFPEMIVSLADLLDLRPEEYKEIVRKWADRFAGRRVLGFGNYGFLLLIVFGLVFASSNLFEVQIIWQEQKPGNFSRWIESDAGEGGDAGNEDPNGEAASGGKDLGYFALYYTIVHAILTPLILSSGLVGVIGTTLLLWDLLRSPIHLEKYRRTKTVISFSTWLLMFALIAFAAILVFGRPTINYLQSLNIPCKIAQSDSIEEFLQHLPVIPVSTNLSNLLLLVLLQSIIAVAAMIMIGSPLLFIRQAIKQAKTDELGNLEETSLVLHDKLDQRLEFAKNFPTLFESAPNSRLTNIGMWLQMTRDRIESVDNIPSLPIDLTAALRVAFGVIVAVGSVVNEVINNTQVLC